MRKNKEVGNQTDNQLGLSLRGKVLVSAPIVLACVLLATAYVFNSGLFINPFAEMMWSALKWGMCGFVLAHIMGKYAFRQQVKEGL